MYSKEDASVNNARIKKLVIVLTAVLIAGIAALIPTLIFRIQWATDLTSCLTGGVIIFIWNLKLTPLIHYRRFLREISNGMSHEMTAEFISFSPDISTHEGVAAHVFEMSDGNKKKDNDRLQFYWDDSKPAPEINTGEMLRITSHGGFIVNWERV